MVEFFFFNDTATTEIYTLSLHDALPISVRILRDNGAKDIYIGATHAVFAPPAMERLAACPFTKLAVTDTIPVGRSEEHTSELQSRQYLVCRLLLEKKKSLHILYTSYINT